jgi:glycosyltransferase involved in cell wall biosynthesis
MVSVLMLTYMQEAYIQRAIEGVLEQQTNFQFKLIIGDDASPDNTSQIVERYKEKYADKIVYVRNKENLGMMKNFMNIYSLASTKYIAICEGDDYWCEVNKLQKQVSFLEANPEYSICFHQVYILKSNGHMKISPLNPYTEEKIFDIYDLAQGNLMHTPSVVFRNNLCNELPVWFEDSPVGDYVLHMLNARFGLIKYFPVPMAVYRKHSDGVWSTIKREDALEKWITVLNYLLEEDFEQGVREKMVLQKRWCVEEFLKTIMNENCWEKFREKITIYSNDDEYILNQWVSKYYPEYIEHIRSGRMFRFASSLRKTFRKITRIKLKNKADYMPNFKNQIRD